MTQPAKPGLPAAPQDSISTLLACWLEGAFTTHEICALAQIDKLELDALASSPEMQARIVNVSAQPHFGPFLARLKARRYIAAGVDRLRDIIQDPDASAASISKATDMLYAISRMRAEDGAKENILAVQPFHLKINIDGHNGHGEVVDIEVADNTSIRGTSGSDPL